MTAAVETVDGVLLVDVEAETVLGPGTELPTVERPDGLRTALKRLAPSDPAVFQIQREGKLMYLAFPRE